MRGPGNGWDLDQAAITVTATAMAMARGMQAATAAMWVATAADFRPSDSQPKHRLVARAPSQAALPCGDDLPRLSTRMRAGHVS
jgi:hypothetical protein